MIRLLEWLGAFTGLAGAGLLATNSIYSGWGFVAFLISNAAWIIFGGLTRTWGLITMQIGFTVTSLLGIYRWF